MITPAHLGFPPKFQAFRRYAGFDQLGLATGLATDDVHLWQMVCGPPGCGKSSLYMAMTRLLEPGSRALVLVGTKGLQAQVYGDFAPMGMRLIQGHRNYACMQAAVKTTCSTQADDPFDLLDDECPEPPQRCLYRSAMENAMHSSCVVGNYAHWLALGRYGQKLDSKTLGSFDLLVLDEAHTAPMWLTDFCAVELRSRRLMHSLGVPLPRIAAEDIEGWTAWAEGTVETICKDNTHGLGRRAERQIADLKRLAEAVTSTERWVGQRLDFGGSTGIRFSPVWGHEHAERYLFRGIPRVLLVSASLTPATGDQLGIPRARSRYIDVPSPFPVSRRPVIYVPTARVDWRTTDADWHRIVRRIEEFAAPRLALGRKGIIHARAYKHAARIIQMSRLADRMIGHTNSAGLRVAVAEFKRSADAVILVSPSVQEGFDFPDDDARWQIILKVAVMDSRDPLTRARLDADRSYRDSLVVEDVLQMAGRPVRSDRDWAETAIFDDHWAYLRNAPFPAWFKAACVWANDLPPPLVPREPYAFSFAAVQQ
jgi:Rad3-related DNA helicase